MYHRPQLGQRILRGTLSTGDKLKIWQLWKLYKMDTKDISLNLRIPENKVYNILSKMADERFRERKRTAA